MPDYVSEYEITDALANCEDDEMRKLVNRLAEERDDLVAELDEVKTARDEVETELETMDSEAFNVLRAVRDWFDGVILFGKTADPRLIRKQVERALEVSP